MAQVMQQAGDPDFASLRQRESQVISHQPGHVHSSQGMLKPGMAGSRINRIHQAQLLDALQPLHRS